MPLADDTTRNSRTPSFAVEQVQARGLLPEKSTGMDYYSPSRAQFPPQLGVI